MIYDVISWEMMSQLSIVLSCFTFLQAYNLLHKKNIFHKNLFLNLEILLKDIFEK